MGEGVGEASCGSLILAAGCSEPAERVPEAGPLHRGLGRQRHQRSPRRQWHLLLPARHTGLPERQESGADAIAAQNTGYRAAGQSFAALALGRSATLKLHFVLPGFRPKSPICNLISEIALRTLPCPLGAIVRSIARAVRSGSWRPDAQASLGADRAADAMAVWVALESADRLAVLLAKVLADGACRGRASSMANPVADWMRILEHSPEADPVAFPRPV